MILLLALHGVVGAAVWLGGRALGRRALLVASLPSVVTSVWAATVAPKVLDGEVLTSGFSWVPGLGLDVTLRLDGFALLMVGLVAGIGALVFAYGAGYFSDEPGVARVAGLLTLFAGAMLGLVLADNLLALFVFWELTSVTSYLLIGSRDREPEARTAALQALLITGGGGLAMLAGFVLVGQAAGTYEMSELLASPPGGTLVSVALVLVLIGACTKSAQYPFHSWLPGAMVAPTPISAYLHSAAMVKAGVYLVARFAPAFADAGVWRPVIVTVGLVTMLAGGLRALRRHDLKQLLAFGTVSQLGFLMVLFGIGQAEATVAGCALLVAHAVFKACLFMTVGVVDHQAHTRDLRELPALDAGWGPTKVVAVVAAASMVGLPPLAGFIAKESAFEAFVHGGAGERVVLAGIVVGSILTMAYTLRFVWGAFGRRERAPGAAPAPVAGFVAPAAVLAGVTVLLGVVAPLYSEIVDAAARALDGAAAADLYLWHGLNVALGLSILTWVVGALLFAARDGVARVQARWALPWSSARAYDATVRALPRFADDVTGVVQSGSLPVYAAVVLSTAAVVPLVGLLSGTWWPGWPDIVGPVASVPIAALLIGAAIATAATSRRFAAALLLGAVGYGMALLFVLQGAPDLALTQTAIETLSIVLFLLVLRQLPDRFAARPPRSGWWRVAVAGAVGASVFVFALVAAGWRTEPPVSEEMVQRSLPEAAGRNVVNVILVDFRGLDTFGEITVLVVAAVGATSLARVGRRRRREGEEAPRPVDGAPATVPEGEPA